MLADMLAGIQARKMNAERFIVFQIVVLQRSRKVKKAKDVRKRLTWRMDAWQQGKFSKLLQNTERTMKSLLSAKQGGLTPEQRAKIFHRKMLRGDVRGVVRYLSDREKGGILQPTDIDKKTGDSVETLLRSKHPDARIPKPKSLVPQHYDHSTPNFVRVNITADAVEKVARRLSGSAGLGGTASHALKHWLLRFGVASLDLREALADFTEWLSNGFPPWARYRALMSGRLYALDKCPGVRPVGVGETWRRATAKILLLVAGAEAKEACCGIDQLCAGLEAGIEGGIHATQALWNLHETEENWGFLLIDAFNSFNEQNRIEMLWVVRHQWPSGARFVFNNCYNHWAVLVLRGNNGHAVFIFSKEGVTQGDPLSMFAYGIGILPLIRQLKAESPQVGQPWYADYAGAGAKFDEIERFFWRLCEIGPLFGYYPEPTKSILIVRQHNLKEARLRFPAVKVKTGNRYLGGFIGEDEALNVWLGKKNKFWTEAVTDLTSVTQAFPQAVYSGLQKSLQ
jgi:hypothetical protein